MRTIKYLPKNRSFHLIQINVIDYKVFLARIRTHDLKVVCRQSQLFDLQISSKTFNKSVHQKVYFSGKGLQEGAGVASEPSEVREMRRHVQPHLSQRRLRSLELERSILLQTHLRKLFLGLTFVFQHLNKLLECYIYLQS